MCRTEIMEQVNEGFISIINQMKTKQTVDTEIMKISKELDILLDRLLDNLNNHDKQKGKAT